MFDSGLGGLTVFREIRAARPDARLRYVADDAFFPYGAHGEAELVGRVVPLMGALIDRYQPALIVIACNTASTLVLPHLRKRYEVPFVGTVPAIKPACASSRTKRVSVLGTEGTVSREYTRALIRDFGNGADVTLVGSAKLAAIAEAGPGIIDGRWGEFTGKALVHYARAHSLTVTPEAIERDPAEGRWLRIPNFLWLRARKWPA